LLGLALLVGLVPALFIRRRFLGTSLALVAALQVGVFALGMPPKANFAAQLAAPYSVALYGSRRGAGRVGGGTARAWLGPSARGHRPASPAPGPPARVTGPGAPAAHGPGARGLSRSGPSRWGLTPVA